MAADAAAVRFVALGAAALVPAGALVDSGVWARQLAARLAQRMIAWIFISILLTFGFQAFDDVAVVWIYS